jgi:hypothetical protein
MGHWEVENWEGPELEGVMVECGFRVTVTSRVNQQSAC